MSSGSSNNFSIDTGKYFQLYLSTQTHNLNSAQLAIIPLGCLHSMVRFSAALSATGQLSGSRISGRNTHRPLRRTLSSPVRHRHTERSSFFSDFQRGGTPPSIFLNHSVLPVSEADIRQVTSSPIEISDSPSSPSVITISSSSDEMEPNSLGSNPGDQIAHGLSEDVNNEPYEGAEQDDHCDVFGDDEEEEEEDEDDCIVTSSFSIDSTSPGLNESSETARVPLMCHTASGTSGDNLVSSTTNGAPELHDHKEEEGSGMLLEAYGQNFSESLNQYLNISDEENPMGARSQHGQTTYCSDTESADEKCEMDSVTTVSKEIRTHQGGVSHHYSPQSHYQRSHSHSSRHLHQRDHRQSPSRLARPSSLTFAPQFSGQYSAPAPSYVSPTLPFAPSQQFVLAGNEGRCCGSNAEPLLLLPHTPAQLLAQPIYTNIAAMPQNAPLPSQIPYMASTGSSSTNTAQLVNPSVSQRMLARQGYQAAVQPGRNLPGTSQQGSGPRLPPPVLGGVKAFNIVPNGGCNAYGHYLMSSNSGKPRLYFQ